MPFWTCPRCYRQFGKARQAHLCAPGITVDAYFADRPPEQRAICDAVIAHLESLGPLVVDPVDVGILLKRDRTFAELRGRKKWLALSMILPRAEHAPRIARRTNVSAGRVANFVNLAHPDEVDDQVRAWLTESYFRT